jgi:hypothetical protein
MPVVALAPEIHGKEGYLGRHIEVAEALFELYAIKDNDVIAIKADVFEVKIAVAIPDAMLSDAAVEKLPVAVKKRIDPVFQEAVGRRRNGDIPIGPGFFEVFVIVSTDRIESAEGVDCAARVRLAMEVANAARDCIHDGEIRRSSLEEPVKHPFFGKPFHVKRVLDRRSRSSQNEPPRSFIGDGFHGDINSRGQAPVQAKLFLAEVFSPFKGREVEKVETHRFLDLVNPVTREEHIGYVCLDKLDRGRMVRIERRRMHQPDKSLVCL